MEVIGQRLCPIIRPQRKWPEIVDNDRVFAVVDPDGRFCTAEERSPRRWRVLLRVLFVTHLSLRPLVYHCAEHSTESSIRQRQLSVGGRWKMATPCSDHFGTTRYARW